MKVIGIPVLAMAALATPCLAVAQQRVTLREAVEMALARSPRAALLAADTAVARAVLRGARAFPNPMLATAYTEDVPQLHATLELPLDLPWLRGPRVGAAETAREAAHFDFALERFRVRHDVEVAYELALAAAARSRLSHRTALDAESLLVLVRVRRDAGDASELDVELASISSTGLANDAAGDSVLALSTLLDLQRAMGLRGDWATIALADTLALPDAESPAAAAPPQAGAPTLRVVVAAALLRARDQALALERRSVLAPPALTFGFDTRDPSGGERGLLPTIGLLLPLPVLSRNGGPIARAEAERDRARAQLELERIESEAAVARAARERSAAMARAQRDGRGLRGAERVAALALRAYAEGAVALPFVLEARRNAREALSRYIADVAAAAVADADLRLVTAVAEAP